jgi:adenylate kinase
VALSAVASTSGTQEGLKFTPGPILLLGPPGVGKGTQAQELMAAWSIPQISTGDLFRANISQGTPLGRQAKSTLDKGELVSDDLVDDMVADRLKAPDTAAGYILDGFPRTLVQADWFDHYLSAIPGSLPVVAVSIEVSYNQLLRRITGRRICSLCKTSYNIYLQPPKVDEICDLDGTPLTRRSDDTEEVFEERMRAYSSLTAPVVEHYRALGRFAEVNGEQPVNAVTAEVMRAVLHLRS